MDTNTIDKLLDALNIGNADERLNIRFMLRYAPFTVKGFSFPERGIEDLPVERKAAENMIGFVRQLDKDRAGDPYIGAKAASDMIYDKLIDSLKTEKGVDLRIMLAAIGALGGYELMRGITAAADGFTGEELFKLNIMIAETTDGGRYLMGDFVGNQFRSFCMTAVQDADLPAGKLLPIAKYCAEKIGSADYWKSPYSEVIAVDAKALAEPFIERFSVFLDVCTLYPVERMMAYAFVASRVITQTGDQFPKEAAMSLLAEFGWRTSHFIE